MHRSQHAVQLGRNPKLALEVLVQQRHLGVAQRAIARIAHSPIVPLAQQTSAS